MRRLLKWLLGFGVAGGIISFATRGRAAPGPSLPDNVTRVTSKLGLASFGAKMKTGGRAVVVITDAAHRSKVVDALRTVAQGNPEADFYFAMKDFVIAQMNDFGLSVEQLPIDVDNVWGGTGAVMPPPGSRADDDGPDVFGEKTWTKDDHTTSEQLQGDITSATALVLGMEGAPPDGTSQAMATGLIAAALQAAEA